MEIMLEIVQIVDTLFFIVLLAVNCVVVGNDIFLRKNRKMAYNVLIRVLHRTLLFPFGSSIEE